MFSSTIAMERYVSSQATRVKINETLDRRREIWMASCDAFILSQWDFVIEIFHFRPKTKISNGTAFLECTWAKVSNLFRSDLVQRGRKVTIKGCQALRGFEEGRVYWIVTSKFSRSSFDFMLAIPRREFKRGRKWDIGIEMSTNRGGGGQRKFREESFDRL